MAYTFGVGPALTSNLHTAVCILGDQCMSRGHSGYEGELWIECSVQVRSCVLADAVATSPETVIAKQLCYDNAIMCMQRDHGLSADDMYAELPTFARNQQEKHYIKQADGVNIYLCNKRVTWK